MRKIAKSKQMKFLDDFSALASSLSGVESSAEPSYECGQNFVFETKGGKLTAQANCGIDYTIFARFDCGGQAAIALGLKEIRRSTDPYWGALWGELVEFDNRDHRLSPHSGKWNFHGDDADAILNAFRDELSAILLSKGGGIMSQEFSPGAQKAVQELMAIFDCKATTRQWNAACKVVEDAAGGAMRKVERIAEFCEFGACDYDYNALNAVKELLK